MFKFSGVLFSFKSIATRCVIVDFRIGNSDWISKTSKSSRLFELPAKHWKEKEKESSASSFIETSHPKNCLHFHLFAILIIWHIVEILSVHKNRAYFSCTCTHNLYNMYMCQMLKSLLMDHPFHHRHTINRFQTNTNSTLTINQWIFMKT